MVKKSIVVKLDQKTDVMPIAMLVQVASQYESSIYVDADEKRVNAKSIMGMMTLGLNSGLKVVVTADGPDEAQAVDGIEAYLS
jgi:catabolite repression HPr-like protein